MWSCVFSSFGSCLGSFMMWCFYLMIDWIHLGIFKYRYASEGPLKGILGYTDEDVVSNDFVGDSRYLSLVLWLFCGLLLLYVGEKYWQIAISSSLRPPLFYRNCLNSSVEIKLSILCWIGFLVPVIMFFKKVLENASSSIPWYFDLCA